MAAPTENLLSHFNTTRQSAFIKQKECYAKSINRPVMFQDGFSTMSRGHLREMHLQQQWQELKERERAAQQHNRQLLQQFEEAQDTLREMMARNAAMKTIRMEYEQYLEKNFPRWQKQLQEKTQAAEKKKMEDYLRSYLKKTEQEQMSNSTADGPLLSQGTSTRPQKNTPQGYSTQDYFDSNQDRSSQYPYQQSSWLTHSQSQTGRFLVRVPAQTHNPTILSPPNFPQSHPFIQHLASTVGCHHPQSRQDAAYSGPSEHNYFWPWTAGMPIRSQGQLYTEEPPFESRVLQTGKQEEEISRALRSKREKCGGSSSSRLSPDLDIKPVRLPSAHAESSESGRESSVTSSREKRKKREKRARTQLSSSESERCASQESSRTSSEIVIASVAVAQSSLTETSTEEEHTRSSRRSKISGGFTVGSPRSEKAVKEQTKNRNEESQPAGEECGSSTEESMKENAGNQSHDENTESCREERDSGSDSLKNEKRFKNETEKQKNSSSEQNSTEENEEVRRKHFRAGEGESDEIEDSEKNESDEEENDNEISEKTNTTEEEVETAGEGEGDQEDDEQELNKLKNKDAELRKQGSASSQDEEEDGSEGSEDRTEDDEEGSNEEEDGESEEEDEHRSEKGEEENRDSEDSIISPQEKRSKQMQIIPEDAAEEDEDDEEEGEEGSSNDDSNEVSDEDDVENLLAPQDQSKTEEKNGKADGKPKAIFHNVDIFQVTDVRSKTDHISDSDEFDHFYD